MAKRQSRIKYVYLATKGGGLHARRIAKDPVFERTRQNCNEFARATTGGRTLREALRQLLPYIADKQVSNRLTREMMRVVKGDTINEPGYRTIQDGNLELLEGFEFNNRCSFRSAFRAYYDISISRKTGQVIIDILPFSPSWAVDTKTMARHFKIISAVVEIDFVKEKYVTVSGQSGFLSTLEPMKTPISLVHAVTCKTTKPLFLVLGIEFYSSMGDNRFHLKTCALNAMAIVKVDRGKFL